MNTICDCLSTTFDHITPHKHALFFAKSVKK